MAQKDGMDGPSLFPENGGKRGGSPHKEDRNAGMMRFQEFLDSREKLSRSQSQHLAQYFLQTLADITADRKWGKSLLDAISLVKTFYPGDLTVQSPGVPAEGKEKDVLAPEKPDSR